MPKFIVYSFFLLLSIGTAQNLSFAVNASSRELYEYELGLSNIELESAKLAFRFAGNSQEVLEFGVSLRQIFSYGPVGNIIFSANSDFSSSGLFDLSASASAVIADIAAEARISYFNDQEGSFSIDDAFQLGSRPIFPVDSTFNFDLSAKYKLDRNTIITADYNFYLLSNVVSNRLMSELGFSKVFGRDGLGVEMLLFQGQKGLADFAFLGASYEMRQKLFPTTKISLRLGVNDAGDSTNVYPGLTISMNKSIRSLGAKWGALIWLEPYRTDLPNYRGKLFYEQEVFDAKLTASLYGAAEENSSSVILSLKYKMTF